MKTILELIWSLLVDFATGARRPFGSETKEFLDDLAKKRTEERIANWPNPTTPPAHDTQGKLKITVK